MFWRTVACLGLLLTGIPSQAQSEAKSPKDSVSVSFPGKTWAVQVDSPGFTVNNRETQKDGREYLLDSFSVADAYLYTILNWTVPTRVDLTNWPTVKRYHESLQARPSVAKAFLEEMGLYKAELARHKAA